MTNRILIHGGLLYDGTGAPGEQADLLIQGNLIQAIGRVGNVADALRVNAHGCVVAPGFIDTHRHCDIAAVDDADFGRIELAQGITTLVGGNCGLSAVPVDPRREGQMLSYLEPITGKYIHQRPPRSFNEYFAALKKARLPLHVGLLAGSCTIKAALLGYGSKGFTRTTLDLARAQVEEAMRSGALGVSLGLMYEPERNSTMEELAYVAGGAKAWDGLLCSHMRSEGDGLLDAIDEVISVAARAGLRLNISHLKATGARNWGRLIHQAIEKIERARTGGLDVSADFYPYAAGATTMLSILPREIARLPWNELMVLLSTDRGIGQLRTAFAAKWDQADNLPMSIGWDRIIISSVSLGENAELSGKSMAQASLRLHCDPEEVLARLIVSEQGKCGVIVVSMAIEDVYEVARQPWSSIISDALYSGGDMPHPRLYDSFPKVIREFVLDRKILSMEEAIRKAASLPAKKLQLKDRGTLIAGKVADIVVFRPETLVSCATYASPRQPPKGIEHTFVQGRLAWTGTNMVHHTTGVKLATGN